MSKVEDNKQKHIINDDIGRRVAEKRKLKKSKGYCCVYCGCRNKLVLTLDHVIPLGRGGPDEKQNKVVACVICNRLKGRLTDKEFRKYLDALSKLYDLYKIKIRNFEVILEFNQSYCPTEVIGDGKVQEVIGDGKATQPPGTQKK